MEENEKINILNDETQNEVCNMVKKVNTNVLGLFYDQHSKKAHGL